MAIPTEIVQFEVYQDVLDPLHWDIYGYLRQYGTSNYINYELIHLYIDEGGGGGDVETQATHDDPGDTPGYVHFSYFFGTGGSHTIQLRYFGSSTYGPYYTSVIPIMIFEAAVNTDLAMDAVPAEGFTPLIVTISGRLTRDDTGAGVAGKRIDYYIDAHQDGGTTGYVATDSNGYYTKDVTITTGYYEIRTIWFGDSSFNTSSSPSVWVTANPPNCTVNSDCPPCNQCVNFNCEHISDCCVSSSQCQSGYVCEANKCVLSTTQFDWTSIAIIAGLLGSIALLAYAVS